MGNVSEARVCNPPLRFLALHHPLHFLSSVLFPPTLSRPFRLFLASALCFRSFALILSLPPRTWLTRGYFNHPHLLVASRIATHQRSRGRSEVKRFKLIPVVWTSAWNKAFGSEILTAISYVRFRHQFLIGSGIIARYSLHYTWQFENFVRNS